MFRTNPWERKLLRISFSGTKIGSKLSECRSEPFPGREKNSEQNVAAENFKNSDTKDTFEVLKNHFVKLSWLLCKTIFFRRILFRSVTSFGTSSSTKLGMLRNKHFLPWNNGKSLLCRIFRICSHPRMRPSLVRMRSSPVVRASDCQCTSCNGPGSVGRVESEGRQMKQC